MTLIQYDPCSCDTEDGVERLREGDSETWRLLINCYSARLRHDIFVSLLKRSISDWSLADIEQETWMVATDKIHSFTWRRRGSLYHWLRVISLYRILSRVPRAKLVEGDVHIDEIDPPDKDGESWLHRFLGENVFVQPSPENELIAREETQDLIKIFLADENPKHVEIAVQRWIEGKKPRELALIHGMSARAISRLLWSLRHRLESLNDSFSPA